MLGAAECCHKNKLGAFVFCVTTQKRTWTWLYWMSESGQDLSTVRESINRSDDVL